MKPRSDSWNHFTKFINDARETKAYCNHYKHEHAASSFTNGATTLNNHVKTCMKNLHNTPSYATKVKQEILPSSKRGNKVGYVY